MAQRDSWLWAKLLEGEDAQGGWPVGLAGLVGSTHRRGDRAEEAEVAGTRRKKERKQMTGGAGASVGERDSGVAQAGGKRG